jgi:hypothetical protein
MSDKMLLTPYGAFSGITTAEYYSDGSPKELRLDEKNMIVTHAGELVPYYGEDTPRRKYKASVSFHKNGMIKAVSLEEQQEVITPIGELPAELVTFYDTGELKRVFPLDGKISGFWSEDDERELNIPLSFEFDFTDFTALLSGICFYKSGDIRSITLFPKEEITVSIPIIVGREGAINRDKLPIAVRHGFSVYESGELQSVEPAAPVKLKTAIGTLNAYNVSAVGINADSNSLVFDKEGRISSLITSSDKIVVIEKSGAMFMFSPEVINDEDEEIKITVPLTVSFDYDAQEVKITSADGEGKSYSLDSSFIISHSSITGCTAEDCKSCTLCGK